MYRKLAAIVVALALLIPSMPGQTLAYAFTGGYYSEAEIGNYRLSVCFEPGYANDNRVVIEHGLERAQQGINNLDWVSFGYLTGSPPHCSSNGALPNLYVFVDDFNVLGDGCVPGTSFTLAYTEAIGVNAFSTKVHFNQDCFSKGLFYLGDSPPVPDNQWDLESIAAHEGMHVLGLDHYGTGFMASPSGPGSPSNCEYSKGMKVSTIAQDDENGLHARYSFIPLAWGDTTLSTYAVCVE